LIITLSESFLDLSGHLVEAKKREGGSEERREGRRHGEEGIRQLHRH